MTRLFASLAVLLSLEAVAWSDISPSDISISSLDPENMVSPVSTVEGPGVKVGEGTVLYPVVGFETGYVSNVFYTADNPQAAGMMRLFAQVGAGNLSGIRLAGPSDSDNPPSEGFQYRASLRASYDLMLTGDQAISGTGGLGIGALARGLTNPSARWAFGFNDDFSRLIRAANFETDANTNRDINSLALDLLYQPSDRAISGYAYFINTLDVFERNEQQFADRMMNVFGVHPQWRWLPQTIVYADLSLGFDNGIGGGSKVSSMPLTTLAGLQTLLSLNTTFAVRAGYTNGFYGSGQSYSAPTGGAELGYRYSPFGRVLVSYDLLYADSINANYYRDHVARVWLQQLVVPFLLMVQPEIHFREYNGVSSVLTACMPGAACDTRDDTIISVIAGMQYNFRNWIAATLQYHFSDVTTNYRYPAGSMPMVDPGFARHEILLGMRVAM